MIDDLDLPPHSGDDPGDVALDRELAETDDLLHGSLAQLLSAPADLGAKTQTRAASHLMSRSLLGTGADLLTVGWHTLRLLFADGEPDDERGGGHGEEER